ncbi:LacI family DNA-binding transcriptional regulator [Achromobacter aloeverae]
METPLDRSRKQAVRGGKAAPARAGDGVAGKRRPSGQGVRMIDVADAAGVSLMTVSRALRQPDLVSEETRKAVLDAVRKTGYVTNSVAATLASNRSNVVGLIVPGIQNSLYAETTKGIADVLRASGLHLILADSGNSLDEEESLVGAMLSQRVCGLILHNTDHTPRALAIMKNAGIPIIETGDIPADPIDMAVSYSNAEASTAMTLHLARRGYKRIAFVSLDTKHNRRASERLRGYLAALKSAGLRKDPRLIREAAPGIASGAEVMSQLMKVTPAVDAIFFAGDVLALGALFEAQRQGWKIPDRVAIASFDDLPILQHSVPRVTCLRLPRLDVGRRSAQALLDRLQGLDAPVHLNLGFEIIQREST